MESGHGTGYVRLKNTIWPESQQDFMSLLLLRSRSSLSRAIRCRVRRFSNSHWSRARLSFLISSLRFPFFFFFFLSFFFFSLSSRHSFLGCWLVSVPVFGIFPVLPLFRPCTCIDAFELKLLIEQQRYVSDRFTYSISFLHCLYRIAYSRHAVCRVSKCRLDSI